MLIKPRMPLGVDNFYELIKEKDSQGRNYTFVDKSLFIKDVIDGGKITLITRPRRFGKTLNMSMIQHFFCEKVGDKITDGLFDNLKISKDAGAMEFQGKYPVIFITFKGIRAQNFEGAFSRLKVAFYHLFKEHKGLLYNDLDDEDKEKFSKIINAKGSLSDYIDSLKFLSALLSKKTKKEVLILLDEYDTPLHDAFCNNYYEEMRSLIAGMFDAAFKGNDYLYKTVITGILKVAKSSLFSEFNNPKIYSVISSPYFANCFGFTEDELVDLLKKANLSKDLAQLKKMYNGYQIEGYTLYNPFSIVNVIADELSPDKLDKSELEAHWVGTGGTKLIIDCIKHNLAALEYGLTNLINNEPIKTRINPDIIMANSLRTSPISFWSLLLISGYLKVKKRELDELNKYQYELLFCNEEIRRAIEILVLDIIGEKDPLSYSDAMVALVKHDVKSFESFLSNYIRNTPSFFDTSDNYQEIFWHGLILGMVSSLTQLYVVRSNRESGDGRYDISIEPRNTKKRQKGVIIELKAAKKDDNLEKLAYQALEQIKFKNYSNEMISKGVKNIMMIGIAFRKKEIVVKY